ncbi:MAG: histidine kinase N-terminal 7TM domain-containing protein [bacterium]|nr:histidine kinase N-terminal 7TM domain-containing protein [bacterium]
MLIFTPQNSLLLIAGLVNLVMSVLVFTRGLKNKINLYFGLLTFFNFLWAIGLIMTHSLNSIDLVGFYDRSTNMFGIGIVVSLFYFTLHFPYQMEKISKIKTIIIWLLAILFSILIYTKWFIISTVWVDESFNYVAYYYKPVFIAYAIYFVVLAVWSISFLLKKYKQAEGIIRQQLKWLILTITIGLIAGAYFDIVVSYFGDFKPGWLGPIFTIFMNAYVFYLITSSKEKINN